MVTRRPTSGGCIFNGSHMAQYWPRTQQTVSLSSAETELHALVKCASESISASNTSEEYYESLVLRVFTDSSTARGIVQRAGVGKVKHLDIKRRWVQESESRGNMEIVNAPRLDNPSDLLTHHNSEPEAQSHLSNMGAIRLVAKGF